MPTYPIYERVILHIHVKYPSHQRMVYKRPMIHTAAFAILTLYLIAPHCMTLYASDYCYCRIHLFS